MTAASSMQPPVTAVTLVFVVFTHGVGKNAARATHREAVAPAAAAPSRRQILAAAGARRAGRRGRCASRWPTPTPGAPRSPRPATGRSPWRSSVADTPQVRAGAATPRPVARRSSRSPSRSAATPRTDFVVVMAPGPHPLLAPRPRQIGRPFIGDLARRPGGRAVHPEVHRHAGPARCARWCPVFAGRRRPGRRAGLGRHHRASAIQDALADRLPAIALAAAADPRRRRCSAPG